jgi:hypothetical protein
LFRDIKERDSINGKIKFRWPTDTVLSCVLGRGTPTTVDITFDTTRKDREARTYITELEDAKVGSYYICFNLSRLSL